jgi:hypothetical protein
MKTLAQEKNSSEPPPLERPLYLIFVLWGESNTKCFLDYCVASLLTPGNLPSLRTASTNTVVSNSVFSQSFQVTTTSAQSSSVVQRLSVNDNFFVTAGVTVPLFSR